MIGDFLSWYLAPWRRMGRGEFAMWLGFVSLPGIVLMLMGLLEGMGPLMDAAVGAMDIMHQAQGGDLSGALSGAQGMQGEMLAEGTSGGFAWGDLINNLCLLVMFPLCRMRLRDMGRVWPRDLVWAVVINVSTVNGIAGLFGVNLLPYVGWVFSMLGLGGYIWLCLAGSAARVAAYDRVPPPQP